MLINFTKIAEEALVNGYVLGVRGLTKDESYSVGDDCRESYEWDLDNDCSTYHTTGETAGGTCCVGVDMDVESAEELAANIEYAFSLARIYGDVGRGHVVIGGRSIFNDAQMDDGEIRIVNAWVEEVLA